MKHYYLFSRNGFTEGCFDAANKLGNVKLVSFADMMES